MAMLDPGMLELPGFSRLWLLSLLLLLSCAVVWLRLRLQLLLRGLLLLRWAWVGLLLWARLLGRPRSPAGERPIVDGPAFLSG